MVNAEEYLNEKYPVKQRDKEKKLDVSKGFIASITNIFRNKELEGHLGLNGFVHLEELDCSNNELTSLDVHKCSNLRILKANGNLLNKIILPTNSENLEILALVNNNFPSQDLSIFSKFINLKELHIGSTDKNKIQKGFYNRFVGSLGSVRDLNNLRVVDISNTDLYEDLDSLPDNVMDFYCLTEQRPESKARDIVERLQSFIVDAKQGKYNLQAWKLAELRKNVEKYQSEIFKLLGRNSFDKKRILEEENNQLEQEKAKLIDEKIYLQREIAELEDELKQKEEKLLSLDERSAEAERQKEIQEINVSLVSKRAAKVHAEGKLEKINGQLNINQKKMSDLQEEITGLRLNYGIKSIINRKRENLESQKQQILKSSKDLQNEQNKELENIERYNKELQNLPETAEKEEQLKEIDNFLDKIKQEKQKQIDDLKEKFKEKLKEIKDLLPLIELGETELRRLISTIRDNLGRKHRELFINFVQERKEIMSNGSSVEELNLKEQELKGQLLDAEVGDFQKFLDEQKKVIDLRMRLDFLLRAQAEELCEDLQKLSLNDKVVENDLEKFTERLGLKQFSNNEDNWRKFYDFAVPNFIWPSTMGINERRLIFDYVIESEWEPYGKELAKNALEYHRLLKSETLDPSNGTHILIFNGGLVKYGSSEEEEEMVKKYPGCFYVPVSEHNVELRRFSAISSGRDWMVHVRLRDPVTQREARMAHVDRGIRMVIDTGAHITILPYFVKQRLGNTCWRQHYIMSGSGNMIFPASRNLLISLGDGNDNNWTREVNTREIYLWERHPTLVNCGLIGYDVLNDIPHYKPRRQPYIFLRDETFDQNQHLRNTI